jgi:hypothetical protein
MMDTPRVECSRTEAERVIGRDLAAGCQADTFSYDNRFENNENSEMDPLFADLILRNRLKIGIIVSTTLKKRHFVLQEGFDKPGQTGKAQVGHPVIATE